MRRRSRVRCGSRGVTSSKMSRQIAKIEVPPKRPSANETYVCIFGFKSTRSCLEKRERERDGRKKYHSWRLLLSSLKILLQYLHDYSKKIFLKHWARVDYIVTVRSMLSVSSLGAKKSTLIHSPSIEHGDGRCPPHFFRLVPGNRCREIQTFAACTYYVNALIFS